MLSDPELINETKRKLRKLKKLEMKIRFGGSCHAVNLNVDSMAQSGRIKLVWDDFFSIGSKERPKKYKLEAVAAMNKDEYKNVLDEFFFNVYYKYYTENGITAAQLYDPELLGWMGLAPDAGTEDIKKRFRELARKYHPDTGGDQLKFIELMDNYHKLID